LRATKRSRIDKADHVICCLVSELKRYGTTTGTAPFAKVHFKVLITLSRSVEAVQAGSGMWSQHACLARRPRGICAPSEVEFIARDRMDMIARYLERRAKTATPCASDSEPLCEAYPGSRSLVQKSLSPQAAPPAVGFRKSLRAGRFLCERFSQEAIRFVNPLVNSPPDQPGSERRQVPLFAALDGVANLSVISSWAGATSS
jgi:hypothetical protein